MCIHNKIHLVAIAVLIVILATLRTSDIQASPVAVDYSVPVRPDGESCVSVGPIPGFRLFAEPAGLMYFTDNSHNREPVGGAVLLPAAFRWAPYDWDGSPGTTITFYRQDQSIIDQQTITTGDNAWGEVRAITEQAAFLNVLLPDTHRSTWLCFFVPQATSTAIPATVTPPATEQPTTAPVATTTNTPVPLTPAAAPRPDIGVSLVLLNPGPTGMTPEPEPIYPSSDGVVLMPAGMPLTVLGYVKNVGSELVTDVVITGTVNEQVKAAYVEEMLPGAQVIAEYTTTVKAGLNSVTVQAMTDGDTDMANNARTVLINGYDCIDGVMYVSGIVYTDINLCPNGRFALYLPIATR